MSLERFVHAQEKTYAGALAELKAGEKTGHWIWWIFPQDKRPNVSERSVLFALADEAEASAYLQHPILGTRYRECVAAVYVHLCHGGVDPEALMGSDTDVKKLRSSLNCFLKVAPEDDFVFRGQAQDILKVSG
jgi:uncharacterized protein (DUF1810 family)